MSYWRTFFALRRSATAYLGLRLRVSGASSLRLQGLEVFVEGLGFRGYVFRV